MSRVQAGKQYVPLRASSGAALTAFIPKGKPVSLEVLQWSLDDLNSYVRGEGFKRDVDDSTFVEFRRTLRRHPNGFKDDYVLLEGVPPTEPKTGSIEWLSEPGKPTDLVFRDVPFLRVIPPKPPVEGRDVYGRVLLPKNRETPPRIHLDLDPQISSIGDELYVASENGQVRLEGQRLRFSPTYEIVELGASIYQTVDWPCSVHVGCDLDGNVKWVVGGDLEVEGHWSAPNVTVNGNVRARSGIQTNMAGVIRIYGNAEVPFIQMSRIGVAGNLVIERSALQSEIRVVGDLRMKGAPGAIMGCTVDVFGSLVAMRVGTDHGRKTILRLHEDLDSDGLKPSRISLLTDGTQVQVGRRKWIQKGDAPFHSEDLPAG